MYMGVVDDMSGLLRRLFGYFPAMGVWAVLTGTYEPS